jgi:hypothetical protein
MGVDLSETLGRLGSPGLLLVALIAWLLQPLALASTALGRGDP